MSIHEVSYDRGEVTFNLVDVLEYLSADQMNDLVEQLACHDRIIEHVAAQIVDGCTENGSWGGKCGAYPEPVTPLDKAMRRIAKASGDIAREEIERLEKALESEKKQHLETSGKYYALQNERRNYGHGF